MNQTTETLKITIANGEDSAQTFEKKLRTDYKRCKGVIGYIVKQAGADKVRIGLQTSNGTDIFESVHQDEVLGSTSVPSDFRYKSVDFESNGNTVKVIVEPIAPLTDDFKMDFVFKVSND